MLPLRFPGQPGSGNFSGVTVLGRGRPEVTQTGDPAEVPGPTLVWEPFWAEAGPRSPNTVPQSRHSLRCQSPKTMLGYVPTSRQARTRIATFMHARVRRETHTHTNTAVLFLLEASFSRRGHGLLFFEEWPSGTCGLVAMTSA